MSSAPRGFLSEVASRMDGAMSRAERGQVTFSQVGDVVNHLHSLMVEEYFTACVCLRR